MAAWSDEQGFQYEVWTDENKDLGLYYGVLSSAADRSMERATVLLDADGTLLLEYQGIIAFNTHPSEVLEDCTLLFGEKAKK